MKISPLYDRVVIQRLDEEKKTAGGIVLPDNATEKPSQGKVIAVGPGSRTNEGTFSALTVKTGDTVLFGKYSGSEVKLGGTDYIVMKEDDIMGIIEE